MKGYKATEPNMTCRGYFYKLGESFHQDGPIQVCVNGFHFCDTVKKCLEFYDRDTCRIFEIEASGIFDGDFQKYACSDIRFIRELSLIEINRAIYGNGYGNGYGDGYGYGNGDGYGYGYGYGINKVLNFKEE